jgi:hypothetical protein
MRVSRDASGTLTITNVEAFVRVLRAGFVTLMLAVWFAPIAPSQRAAWALVFGLFALALTAADERSLFVFDSHAGVLRWRKDTPFRHSAGTVAFSAITGLSIERDFARPGQRGGARRLVILTTKGPLPITSAFTGWGRAAEETGQLLREYLIAAQPQRTIDLIAV